MKIKICIIGLGYVGLPVFLKLSSKFDTIGFDINKKRIQELRRGLDRNLEFSKKVLKQIELLSAEKKVKAYLEELAELDALFFKQLQLINKAEAMVKTATENSEFSKDKINTTEQNIERIKELSSITSSTEKKKPNSKKNVTEKKEKVDTKKVTFDLYKQGSGRNAPPD